MEALAERIKQRFGPEGYRPILLVRSHQEPPEVFRFYRAADLCYDDDITSLDAQIRIGISTYFERYSASGSSGRIWPADWASLNSRRTSPSLLRAFKKSRM